MRGLRIPLLLLGLLPFQTSAQEAAPRWSVPEAGISMEVPEGWKIRVSKTGRPHLMLSSRFELRGDSVTVRIKPTVGPPPPVDFEALRNVRVEELTKPGVTVQEVDVRTHGKQEGVQSHWVIEFRGLLLANVSFEFPSEKGMVTVTCTSQQRDFANTRHVYGRLLASLRALPKGWKPKPGKRRSEPSLGVSVVPPGNWIEERPAGYWEAARWVLLDTRTGQGREKTILIAEAEPDQGRTLDAYVRKLAKDNGLKAEPAGKQLVGEAARVLTSPTARILVACRGEVFYSLTLLGEQNADTRADFEFVRASFRAEPRQPAVKLLEAWEHVWVLKDPRLNVEVPKVLRNRVVEDHRVALSVHMWGGTEPVFNADFANAGGKIDPGQTLEQIRDRFDRIVSSNKQIKLRAPLTWHRCKSKLHAFRTDLVPMRAPNPAGEMAGYIAYCLVLLDEQTIGVITFNAWNKTELKTWNTVIARICDSLDTKPRPR